MLPCPVNGSIIKRLLSIQWIQNSNTPCQQTTQVCGFAAGQQSNWLITQLISRIVNGTRLSSVTVQIEFELQDCNVMLNCQRTFNTYVFETTSTDNATRRVITNYDQVQRVSPDMTSGQRVVENVTVNFQTDQPSFYFAVEDETSCLVITRLIVFYHVCPSQTVDFLTLATEIIAPSAAPITVTATCLSSAVPESDNGPKLICSAGGLWSIITNSGCRCKPGFGFMNESCSSEFNWWRLTFGIHIHVLCRGVVTIM